MIGRYFSEIASPEIPRLQQGSGPEFGQPAGMGHGQRHQVDVLNPTQFAAGAVPFPEIRIRGWANEIGIKQHRQLVPAMVFPFGWCGVIAGDQKNVRIQGQDIG